MEEKIPRQEFWRRQYRAERYMRGLTAAELDHRFADVMSNSWTLNDDGKLSQGGEQTDWLEKFAHLMEEFDIRGYGLPLADTIRQQLAIPDRSGLELALSVKAQLPNRFPDKFTLFKYGKRKNLWPLLQQGELRLSPGSFYLDPSLNFSVRDKELEFEKIVGHKRQRISSTTDFFVFCTSWIPNNRLVADFEADSVLVISDPHEFFRRLCTALNRPDFKIFFDRVTYVDPLLLDNHVPESLFLWKHLRFAYQFEHRLVMVPPTPVAKLEHQQLVLGGLSDIAKLCCGEQWNETDVQNCSGRFAGSFGATAA